MNAQKIINLLLEVGAKLGPFVEDGAGLSRKDIRGILVKVRAMREELCAALADAAQAEPVAVPEDFILLADYLRKSGAIHNAKLAKLNGITPPAEGSV